MKLTKELIDKELIAWIDTFQKENRYAPSVREVATYLGMGTAATHSRLSRLREENRLTWNEGETRTLRVVE